MLLDGLENFQTSHNANAATNVWHVCHIAHNNDTM